MSLFLFLGLMLAAGPLQAQDSVSRARISYSSPLIDLGTLRMDSVAAYRFAVPDADAAMERAVSAGATVHSPVQDAFWGVRTGEVLDPSGHRWAFDQRLREVPVEEIEAQLTAMFESS